MSSQTTSLRASPISCDSMMAKLARNVDPIFNSGRGAIFRNISRYNIDILVGIGGIAAILCKSCGIGILLIVGSGILYVKGRGKNPIKDAASLARTATLNAPPPGGADSVEILQRATGVTFKQYTNLTADDLRNLEPGQEILSLVEYGNLDRVGRTIAKTTRFRVDVQGDTGTHYNLQMQININRKGNDPSTTVATVLVDKNLMTSKKMQGPRNQDNREKVEKAVREAFLASAKSREEEKNNEFSAA